MVLKTLETKASVQKFNCQQLKSGHWCETRPTNYRKVKKTKVCKIANGQCRRINNRYRLGETRGHGTQQYLHWNKATPKAQWSLLLHSLHKTVRQSAVEFLIRRLTHELCSHSIKWGHGACHKESSQETRTECSSRIFSGPAGAFYHISLRDIVDTHFGRIQRNSSHNIHIYTTVESCDTLVLVHLSDEGGERNGCALVRLTQGLQNIERISGKVENEFERCHTPRKQGPTNKNRPAVWYVRFTYPAIDPIAPVRAPAKNFM